MAINVVTLPRGMGLRGADRRTERDVDPLLCPREL